MYLLSNLQYTNYTVVCDSGGSRKFWWGGIWSTKPQKFGCLHQNWEWFFGRNRKFKRFFRPNSGGLQRKKKKKKKVFTKIETDFSPDSLRLGRWGGDASRNGAELFETEADFSAKIVTFRLVGGMHPPHPPPKSATGLWPGRGSKQIICPIKCQHFWEILQKTVFAICYLSNCNYRIFVKKMLLEFGFIEEMRTTWGNKEMPQTFFHNYP